jgi:cellulose synthase/poly-beta-1,6-N-acetylglucosamine synthase-like glycosyltransferase
VSLLAAGAALALLFVWVGYPLAIALLAALVDGGSSRRRRRAAASAAPPAAGDATPSVSVVIATRDDVDAVVARARDVLASAYPADRLEVVIALDAAGARATADQLRAAEPRLVVVQGDAPGGKSAALDAGVRAATGELLVFTDTHQRFHADAIARLAAFLAAHVEFDAVSGALDLGARERGQKTLADHYWSYEKWLRANEARVHSTVGVTGAIYAMRRAAWTPLPARLILDDVYTPMRLVLRGARVGFEDAARAVDVRRFDAGQEYRRKVRTLTGVIQLCAWLPGVLVPVRNPIWAQFLCHKLLRLLSPYLAALAALGALAALWRARAAVAAALGVRWPVLLGALAAAVALAALLPRVGPRLRGLVVWGVALQAAVVVATVNGVRRRWDVWQK